MPLDLTRSWRGLWGLEDILLILLPPLTVLLARWELARGIIDGVGGSVLGRLALFALFEFGLLGVLASRPPPDEPSEESDIWGRLHLLAANVGVIFGIPLLFLLIAHGAWGSIYLFAGAHVLACIIALMIGRQGGGPVLSYVQRRLALLLPFLMASYFTIRLLTARFLFGDAQLQAMVSHLKGGDLTLLAVDALEVVFLGFLFVVPFVVLVVFPRFIAGDVEGPWVWLRRYAGFCLSLCLCLAGLLMVYGG